MSAGTGATVDGAAPDPGDRSATGGPEPPSGADRTPLWIAAGGWRGLTVALALFAATRVGQVLLIGALTDRPVASRLLIWDSDFFIALAEEGYPQGYSYRPDGTMIGNGLAFFPAYPLLIRFVMLFGLDGGTAALVANAFAATAAALGLHLLGSTLADKRVGWALVVLVCAQPMSVVLSMAYSECLFLALLVWMLVAAHRRMWLLAGVLGLCTALARPTGAAAAVALAVAAALAWRTADRWRAIGAAALALVGTPAYLAWVAVRVGEWDGYFTIQSAGWGTTFDFGAATARFLSTAFRNADSWVAVSAALMIVAAAVAVVVAALRRVWAPLVVYGILAFGLVVGQSNYFHSKPRLLVPVLLVLIPAALAAARARPRVAVPALTAWALFGLWYGATMITVWPYTM